MIGIPFGLPKDEKKMAALQAAVEKLERDMDKKPAPPPPPAPRLIPSWWI